MVHLMVAGTPTIDPRLRELLFFASSLIAPISAWYDREHTHTHEEYYVRPLSHTKAWFVVLDLKLVYPRWHCAVCGSCITRVKWRQRNWATPKVCERYLAGRSDVFHVCTQDRIYHLAAECTEDKQQWIGTLNKVLHGGQMVRQPAE